MLCITYFFECRRSLLTPEEEDVVSFAFGGSYGLEKFLTHHDFGPNGFYVDEQQKDKSFNETESNQIRKNYKESNPDIYNSKHASQSNTKSSLNGKNHKKDNLSEDKIQTTSNRNFNIAKNVKSDYKTLLETINVTEFFFNKSFPYYIDL